MLEQGNERDSEARWQAWLAKGRAHDLGMQKSKVFGLSVFAVAALSIAVILVLY